MSEVEQLAQEQFKTFRNRLCDILSEIEEEHKPAFMQGYAKGETDEKFRTKQVVVDNPKTKEQLEVAKEIIKELLDCYKYVIRFREYADKKPINKAEQFLKEIEE